MAMWPFRRKSRKKRLRASTTDFEDARGRISEGLPPRSQTLQDVTMPALVPEPEQTTRKQRPEPNKLQRRQRTYSFSPGRKDSIGMGRRTSVRAKRETPTPAYNPAGIPLGGGLRRTGDYSGIDKETGIDTVGEDSFRRVPTLHNKRDGDHLPRKKSSKKRRKDDQREAEIKAMSNFMPVRPATDDWITGRLVRNDSKRARIGFGLGLRGTSRHEWDKYNRLSDISLPAESLHSAASSDSEHISFKVSALEALAPRPTLRFATHQRSGGDGGDGDPRLARTLSRQQRKLSAPIPESTLKAHKKIHDLADELSAGDLRELMERDNRRRERKRQRDQARLEQRLARRAEKQKADEAEAEREGRGSPPNLERGVLGRESLGLGAHPASAVVTSSRVRQSDESLEQKGKHPEDGDIIMSGSDSRPHPLAAFHRTNSIPLQSPGLPKSQAEPKAEPAQQLTSPKSRSSFIRIKLSRSKTPEDSDLRTEHSETPQRASEGGSSKGPLSWASFFRWGNRHKRNSKGPSSFSNTSRDSMPSAQHQPPAPPANFVPRRLSSGVPKRTMSRFREDLPELPLSPPDSRIQSPETGSFPLVNPETSPDPNATGDSVIAPPAHYVRYDTPTSEQRSMEAMRRTPSTFGHPDEPSMSPELQTMSLASIDSEGSWLSGRPSKKRKPSGNLQSTPYGLRPRRTSDTDTEHAPEHDNTNEDISIADDDYLARLTPSAAERNRKSTGDPRPSSDGEEETHWGSVRGHQPHVVHTHTAGRVKSREGLLKAFGEEGEIDAVVPVERTGDNESIDAEAEGEGLQRATSVNLGKGHVRHISAGSARLLSISPPSSVDTKRFSLPPSQEKTETS